MKLYKEKLENLKNVENSLKDAQNAFEKVKKDLEEYVKENIVSGKYTIGSKKLENEYELFYPVLSFPEGIRIQSETFWCDYEENISGHGEGPLTVHQYILLDEKENIEISVTEKSNRDKLEYDDNLGNYLRIKNKINVMGDISYDIKIGEMQFHFTRNFGYSIKKSFLINLLKDKYICYKDFRETPTYNRTKITCRFCDNRRLEENKIDWKNVLQNYKNTVNGFFTYCDFDKIVSDIEQILIQGEYEKNPITKSYSLKGKDNLVVSVIEEDNDHCIYYEDELMTLELNTPFQKQTFVKFDNAELSYQKILIKREKIDMDKPMSVLEIFNLK